MFWGSKTMAQRPGDRLSKAAKLGTDNFFRSTKDSIGGRNKVDFYSFNLTSRHSFNFTLAKSKSSLNIAVLNHQGRVLTQIRSSKQKQPIDIALDQGTYYVRVSPGRDGRPTQYRLTTSATPVPITSTLINTVTETTNNKQDGLNQTLPSTGNSATLTYEEQSLPNQAPTIVKNSGLTLAYGETKGITNQLLQTTDTEQGPKDLQYTINKIPTYGRLYLNGVELFVGDRFSQADIDEGRLSYINFTASPTQSSAELKYTSALQGSSMTVPADFNSILQSGAFSLINESTGEEIKHPTIVNGKWILPVNGEGMGVYIKDDFQFVVTDGQGRQTEGKFEFNLKTNLAATMLISALLKTGSLSSALLKSGTLPSANSQPFLGSK